MPNVAEHEIELLNFYRASELHGGLVLGQMVARARDTQLALDLTRHSAEEVVHAQLWTETIIALRGDVRPVRDTYQRYYARLVGAPTTMLEVLAITQVFERRVYRHFTEHLHRPGTHSQICTTLWRMIDEEKGHLNWVARWLKRRTLEGAAVSEIMRRYEEADEEVYATLLRRYAWWREAA